MQHVRLRCCHSSSVLYDQQSCHALMCRACIIDLLGTSARHEVSMLSGMCAAAGSSSTGWATPLSCWAGSCAPPITGVQFPDLPVIVCFHLDLLLASCSAPSQALRPCCAQQASACCPLPCGCPAGAACLCMFQPHCNDSSALLPGGPTTLRRMWRWRPLQPQAL